MVRYVMRTHRVFVFIRPMNLPWVVITDPFESQDILLRRTKEFDRSTFFAEIISDIQPEGHNQFLSTDARFKHNRNLINHLMAPTFLTQVSGPQIYKAALAMIRLWELKTAIAKGHPFNAHEDITYMTLDAIFAAMFGHPESDSCTTRRLASVSDGPHLSLPPNPDTPMTFPPSTLPSIFAAALTVAGLLMNIQLSPLPRITSWILCKFPYMKRATAIKDGYIRDAINSYLPLLTTSTQEADEPPQTALQSVLLRERAVATRAGRPPQYYSRAIADEFFGFMLAGHDTSATTLAWGVKLLADYPVVQDKLRAGLRTAFHEAMEQRRLPSYTEFVEALLQGGGGEGVEYLDAVVEEILRHANTVDFVVRRVVADGVKVLGKSVPRGTDVFMPANGAGYLKANMVLADKERSPGARREKGEKVWLTRPWDNADLGEFKPERWLKEDGTFDHKAGPTLAFGLGPRGCYGKKFALLQLRIQLTLLVLRFRLLKTPVELSGYDAVQRVTREPKQCYVRLSDAMA
ncbi:hypothetical protein N0V88_005215 [Collariella sp. IMI 366227]|nr:hypothetical protein N0V88_005215 [Collariella sp. IMI 366227]